MMAQLLQLLDWNRIRNKPTSFGGTVDRSINQFRLTLESGVFVSTTDQTAKTTVYACPASGGAATEAQITLLGTDDTTWATHSTAQMSIGTTTTRNGTTTNGSAVITGLATTVDLVVGQVISGTGVGAGSTIASIDSATQITGTVNSTASATVSVTFRCLGSPTRNGTTTNGNKIISGLSDTSDLAVGQAITGTGVGAASVIASIDSASQVTGTVNSTASATVAVTFTAKQNYDLFVLNIAGTPTLVFAPVWTSDTARATAITQKDGVPVLSGAFVVGGTSYAEGRLRHIGMVRTTAIAGQTELSRGGLDVIGKCFIWSRDNKEDWEFFVTPNASSWSYATNTWRQVRGNANMQIEFISGEPHRPRFTYMITCASSSTPVVAIDIDSTNTPTDEYPVFGNSGYQIAFADHDAVLAAGYHYAAAIEYGNTGTTFYGYSAGVWKMGLKGRMRF